MASCRISARSSAAAPIETRPPCEALGSPGSRPGLLACGPGQHLIFASRSVELARDERASTGISGRRLDGTGGLEMLRQIALGGSISLLNFAIHAILVSRVVVAAHRAVRATARMPPPRRLVVVTGTTATVLMFGHVAEVGVWAIFYAVAGVAPTAERRLIGPITAMNGVLLFGWSTAVLFDVIRTVGETLRRRPPGAD